MKVVKVMLADEVIAETTGAYRVLETSHPPSWYIPRADVRMEFLTGTPKGSFCEWKGQASYWTVRAGDKVAENAGWSYASPSAPFAAIKDYVAFYPGLLECYVDGERVQPQPGGFYGGWITADLAGPFKGVPGSGGW